MSELMIPPNGWEDLTYNFEQIRTGTIQSLIGVSSSAPFYVQGGATTVTLNYSITASSPSTTNVAITSVGGQAFPNQIDAIIVGVEAGPNWPTYYAADISPGGNTFRVALVCSAGAAGSGTFSMNWIAFGH